MKQQAKLFSLLLLLSVVVGVFGQTVVASPPAQQVQFTAPRLVVNASFLNARVGPGVQYAVLITLVGGTELPVLGRASDNVWFQVSTPVGVAWVNSEFTIPRGNFERVPTIRLSDIAAAASTAATVSLPGQGGGGGAPVVASSGQGGGAGVELTFGEFATPTIVVPGERFRVKLEVEAVNVRTQPMDGASSLGTIYRDETNATDYALVGSSRDGNNVDWFAIAVAGIGTGWIEAPKVTLRLSRVSGDVQIVIAQVVQMTDTPGGSGTNMPNLTSGREGFLVGASQDGKFLQLELADGLRGWVPADAVTHRTGTVTDLIDLSLVGSAPVNTGVTTATTAGTGTTSATTTVPGSLTMDTPHVVVNTPFLNGRSGPGVQYTVVATFSGGTELPVIGIASDGVWMLVTGPFGQAWVNDEYAVFRGSIQAVPVIRNAAGVLSTPTAIISAPVTIYAAPGTNFGAIGTVPAPAEVAVVARTADFTWVQLNTTLGFGWVLANQVILQGDTSLIPVVG